MVHTTVVERNNFYSKLGCTYVCKLANISNKYINNKKEKLWQSLLISPNHCLLSVKEITKEID